ncbi:MAG TPA: ABC transporter permease, partial [Blastocatellia bacterium]
MSWWSRLLHRKTHEELLDKELQFHLEQHAADLIAGGLNSQEAFKRAGLELGGAEQVKERCRDARGTRWIEEFFADLRYAARRLRTSAGFAVVSVLTLALGIGASTAIFSAVNPILFEPLPYPDPSQVVMIGYGRGDAPNTMQSFGTYRELAERNRSFEALAVMKAWLPTMTGKTEPERLNGQMVSAPFFRVLGVLPARGHDFDPSDDRLNGAKVVVVSDRLWRRRLGGDNSIVGKQIQLDDNLYTVTGIMPLSFEDALDPSTDVWTMLQYDTSLPSMGREWGHHLRLVGRLRPGVGITQGRAELDAIATSP